MRKVVKRILNKVGYGLVIGSLSCNLVFAAENSLQWNLPVKEGKYNYEINFVGIPNIKHAADSILSVDKEIIKKPLEKIRNEEAKNALINATQQVYLLTFRTYSVNAKKWGINQDLTLESYVIEAESETEAKTKTKSPFQKFVRPIFFQRKEDTKMPGADTYSDREIFFNFDEKKLTIDDYTMPDKKGVKKKKTKVLEMPENMTEPLSVLVNITGLNKEGTYDFGYVYGNKLGKLEVEISKEKGEGKEFLAKLTMPENILAKGSRKIRLYYESENDTSKITNLDVYIPIFLILNGWAKGKLIGEESVAY